jgi:hypothetical protein
MPEVCQERECQFDQWSDLENWIDAGKQGEFFMQVDDSSRCVVKFSPSVIKKQFEGHPCSRLRRPWRHSVNVERHDGQSRFGVYSEDYSKFGKFKRNQCVPDGEIVATFFTSTRLEGDKLTGEFIARCTDRAVDIAELFPPPRVSKLGREKFGFQPGGCFDIRTGYDLSKPEVREAVWQRIIAEAPLLLMTSPPCTEFSILQRNFNHPKMDPIVRARKIKEAKELLEFALRCCEYQAQQGRYFVHEHPFGASPAVGTKRLCNGLPALTVWSLFAATNAPST